MSADPKFVRLPISKSHFLKPSLTKQSLPSRTSACFKNWRRGRASWRDLSENWKRLGEVGQAVSSTLDLQTVLSTIVGHAVQLSGTDGGVIYEYDETAQEFHLRASHRMEEEMVEALRRRGASGTRRDGANGDFRAPVQVVNILEEQEYTGTRVRPDRSRGSATDPFWRFHCSAKIGSGRLDGLAEGSGQLFDRCREPSPDIRDPISPRDTKRAAVPRDRG